MSADAQYSNRTYYFSAIDGEEMEQWIESLTIAGRPHPDASYITKEGNVGKCIFGVNF
jgi:hypothetical protein